MHIQALGSRLKAALFGEYLRRLEYVEHRLTYLGWIGLVGYPLFYVVCTYLLHQSYESLPIRILATVLAIPFILKNHWPLVLRPYLPAYIYIGFLLGLPSFFTFMLLKNQASLPWIIGNMFAWFILIIMLDWRSVVLMTLAGTAIGILSYALTEPVFILPSDYWLTLPSFLLILGTGVLLNYSDAVIEAEKKRAMWAMCANLAHEMRTPLLSIKSGAQGIKKFLPLLLSVYDQAVERKDPVPSMRLAQRQALASAARHMVHEVNQANTVIDMLLINLRGKAVLDAQGVYSVGDCIDSALARYPYGGDDWKKINLDKSQDFLFKGSDSLLVYVIFNLLKNALYAIAQIGKGEIYIRLEQGKGQNYLYFKDTASGIPKSILPRIFEPFFTSKAPGVGTGVGLHFCKKMLQDIQGDIRCHSVEGEYTEFILTFPATKQNGIIQTARYSTNII